MQTLNRGAPLDVAFINEMVNEIDRLVAATNTSQYKRATIADNVLSFASSTVRTADVRIHAEMFPLAPTAVEPGKAIPFRLALTNFSSTPVATVTPIILNAGQSSAALTVVITSVTSTSVAGYVVSDRRLDTTQSISLSLIAIGMPSLSAS